MTRETDIKDIQKLILDSPSLHIKGSGTKTALSCPGCPVLDMSQLSGMIEYQPDEYTFTAYAGTSVKEIQSVLNEHGQYLPCDPLLVDAGATAGGTIAANLSGSRRFRYGGVRDFLLGASVIDGRGRFFRVGGRVVKNAAGFDLAKFLVGSLGLYMLMIDVTFKVFPDKPAFLSYRFDYAKIEDVLIAIFFLNRQPFELDALDIEVHSDGCALIARFAGTAQTLSTQLERFSTALNQHSAVQTMSPLDDNSYWQSVNALNQADKMLKVPLAPRLVPLLDKKISVFKRRYTAAANIAWIESDDSERLSSVLTDLNLTGLQILGHNASPLIGKSIDNPFTRRVKTVLDPDNRFV